VILLAGVAAALPLVTRHFALPGFAIAYAIAVALWFIARRMAVSLRGALIIATLARASFLFTDPVLSGDVFRYLWDGRVLTAGVNPYAAAPDDPRFERLREPWHSRINHPEIRTIYPPLAEILFAAAPGLVSWRLMLIIADLVTIRLLRRRPELLLGVALFPPMLIETAWSAHVEAIAAMLLLTSTLHDSGAAAGAAAGIKIIPIAALPALLRRSAHRGRFVAAATLAIAIPALPFLFGSHFMSGMREYATRWIFNSPLYDAIYFLAGQTHAALRLKGIFTAIKDPLYLEWIAPFVYAHLYSDFLTRCALGVLAVVAILVLARATGKVSDGVGALLLCSPAIHPWYWLVLAPVAMWEARRLWIGFALFAPMSYLLYVKSAAEGGGATRILVYIACYAMPVIIARLRPSANAT
jgi:alpha-1,6-mannosyltransferase